MINRILDSWSFHMKFKKVAEGLFYKFHEMTTHVRSSIFLYNIKLLVKLQTLHILIRQFRNSLIKVCSICSWQSAAILKLLCHILLQPGRWWWSCYFWIWRRSCYLRWVYVYPYHSWWGNKKSLHWRTASGWDSLYRRLWDSSRKCFGNFWK